MGRTKKRKPFEVYLCGHTFSVRWVSEPAWTREYRGQTFYEKREILLDENLSGSMLQETFVHECVHLVSHAMELNLDEATTQRLGVGLQQILAPFLDIDV